MFHEAIDELSGVFWDMTSLVATVGTAVMVFVFIANQLSLTGSQYWMFLTVTISFGFLFGFTLVLIQLNNRTDVINNDYALLAVASDAFLSVDTTLIDEQHAIDKTEQTIDLTNNGNDVVMTESWEGKNVRNDPSEGFKYYYESEAFLKKNEGTTARQILDNGKHVEMEIEPININDQFTGVYQARYQKEVKKGDSFSIEIENRLGPFDISVGQYLYFDFNRFERGVKKALCRVIVDTTPDVIKGYKVVNTADMTHQNDPTKLDYNIEPIEVYSDKTEQTFWVEGQDLQDTIFILKLEW